MRNILAALLTAALCLGLAACGPAPEPEPTPTPTPSVSPSPEAAEFALACYPEAGFHPITGSNRTNLALGGLLYEGLFALDGQFQPQEALCASASVSADGLQWSFIPRSGVTFSDGSPLTAAEIAASLNLARTSPLYSARFAGVTDIAAANGMVTVTLSRANGALPALLDIPIVKETGGVPLGTGPYVLAGTGENLALEARSDWWQGKALPRDTIPLRAIQEADDLIHAFDTRDIALVSTDLTGTNALGFSGSFAAVDYPTSTMLYVGFNTADGPCRSGRPCCGALTGPPYPPPSSPATPSPPPFLSPPPAPSTTRRWPRRWTTPPRPWSRSSPLPATPEPTGYGRRRGGRWRSPLWPQTTTPTGWPRRRRWPPT